MKKTLIASTLLLAVSACSTVTPPTSYRPANYAGEAWQISVQRKQGAVSDTISTIINGETVSTLKLTLVSMSSNATGSYDGRTVSTDCQASSNAFSGAQQTTCNVMVAGERATSINF